MRRADRLFRIIQLLRRRKLARARDLAEKLEVSERTIYRDIAHWDPASVVPARARLAGLLSLVFWIAIIAAGRAIAYAPGYDLG